MAVPQSSRHTELEQAFDLFSQVSERLSHSYRELETRVAQLTGELEQARCAHARSHSESERLGNRLGHLFAALPAGIVVLDSHGRVQECNPAAVELLGEPLAGQAWSAVIARAFAPRPDDGHEISLRDGRRVGVATRALDPESGQLVLLTDLTSTRELQDRLARHERLATMGEMVASLAHQIRTPLATALLYISHLQRPAIEDVERRRVADKILARLNHLEHLVNDMLVFARGGVSIAATVTLAPLLDEVAQAIEPQMQGAGCRFRVQHDLGRLELPGNREALAGALTNLLANAMQACGVNGEISLTATRRGDAIEIAVRDNGPGIAPEAQARLFEPFFTTRSHGTGLGLAVVQAVAQAHGGSAWVESQLGEGSVFGLRLPIPGSRVASRESRAENEETRPATLDSRLSTRDSGKESA
jgi:two-component system sensor histidine kinase FlrB